MAINGITDSIAVRTLMQNVKQKLAEAHKADKAVAELHRSLEDKLREVEKMYSLRDSVKACYRLRAKIAGAVIKGAGAQSSREHAVNYHNGGLTQAQSSHWHCQEDEVAHQTLGGAHHDGCALQAHDPQAGAQDTDAHATGPSTPSLNNKAPTSSTRTKGKTGCSKCRYRNGCSTCRAWAKKKVHNRYLGPGGVVKVRGGIINK